MKKFLILIDGPMGSGKTTTSKLVNARLPDTARIALPDVKRLVPNFRENDKTLAVVRDVVQAMMEKYLEHGISVIVEQITSTDGILPLIQVATRGEDRRNERLFRTQRSVLYRESNTGSNCHRFREIEL